MGVKELPRDTCDLRASRLLLSHPPPPLPCSAETPEQRNAPLRCSDVSFIVKHLPRVADPEAIARQAYAPTQGGWPHEIPQFREADDEASAYINCSTGNALTSKAGSTHQQSILVIQLSGQTQRRSRHRAA